MDYIFWQTGSVLWKGSGYLEELEEGQKKKETRKSVMILAFVVFLVMLGFGLVIPVLPYYSMSFGATSFHLGLLMGVYSFMQLLFAPMWGRLGDQKGRKPVLLTGIGGFALTFALYGVAGNFWTLFTFRALSGVFSAAAMPTAMAMVGDMTSVEERGRYMGLVGAMTGLGMILGPALGGILGKISHTLPFFIASLVAAFTLIIATIVLRESVDLKTIHYVQAKQKKQSLFNNIWQGLKGSIAVIMVLNFILSYTNANFETTFSYLTADKFNLNSGHLGMAFMVMGIITVVFQAGLFGVLLKRFGEGALIKAGAITIALSFILIILSKGVVPLFLSISVTAAGLSILRPSINSLVSKSTSEGQGLAMGLLSSFDSLGRVLGPVIGGALYLLSHSVPYWSSAALLIGFLVCIWASPMLKGTSFSVKEKRVKTVR